MGGQTLKVNVHTYHTYRNLLGKLQQTFDGEPEMLIEAVSIMESLLVHARRVHNWARGENFCPQYRSGCYVENISLCGSVSYPYHETEVLLITYVCMIFKFVTSIVTQGQCRGVGSEGKRRGNFIP